MNPKKRTGSRYAVSVPHDTPERFTRCGIISLNVIIILNGSGVIDYANNTIHWFEPTRLQDAVCMANNIIDQKLKGYAMKNVENKRKFDNNQKDNRGQQPPFKRHNVGGQNVARAYTAGNNERRVYKGLLPLCNKCKFHHEGPYTMRCGKCNKVRHFTRDGHYRSDCPKLKDNNRGNKTRNKSMIGEARGKSYVLGWGDANTDSNVVTGWGRWGEVVGLMGEWWRVAGVGGGGSGVEVFGGKPGWRNSIFKRGGIHNNSLTNHHNDDFITSSLFLECNNSSSMSLIFGYAVKYTCGYVISSVVDTAYYLGFI
uniref:Reverse transcriptase domain-containing protein n=1 Tax=Tanacetum cinerariifolium TaxID=118510 RepID=A0A6L2MWR4_TANCI|nr:hypothetical protein [Tanacetum cinerariifolium]